MGGTDTAAKPLTAIKIHPDACRVELIQVQPDEVAGVLRSALTETMDFEEDNCLVIDDGSAASEHPSRFHFGGDAFKRPFFGPVLILGMANSNWASTTLDVEDIRARIIWEQWNLEQQRYGEPALELA